MCGAPWNVVALGLKLTWKVTADEEGAGSPLPRIVVERMPEAQLGRFYVLSADTEARAVPQEVVRAVQRWYRVEERSNHATRTNQNDHQKNLLFILFFFKLFGASLFFLVFRFFLFLFFFIFILFF